MNALLDKKRKAFSAVLSALCLFCALMVLLPLALILFHLARMGAGALNWNFLTQLPGGGGMANAIVGSFVLVALAVLLGVPVGVLGGIYLSEFGSPRFSRTVRFVADVLSGTPSIVWGILVYALMVVPMKGSSALAGGVALGLIMIPLVMRTTEEMLSLVPDSCREAAMALGIPKWKSILHIVLKAAGKGIITGILMACARVAGETAPLLFTAAGNQYWSHSLTEPMASLPGQIYTYARQPYVDWHRQAWAGALVLVFFVLAFNAGVRFLTRGANPPLVK